MSCGTHNAIVEATATHAGRSAATRPEYPDAESTIPPATLPPSQPTNQVSAAVASEMCGATVVGATGDFGRGAPKRLAGGSTGTFVPYRRAREDRSSGGRGECELVAGASILEPPTVGYGQA